MNSLDALDCLDHLLAFPRHFQQIGSVSGGKGGGDTGRTMFNEHKLNLVEMRCL